VSMELSTFPMSPLSLHDALPISSGSRPDLVRRAVYGVYVTWVVGAHKLADVLERQVGSQHVESGHFQVTLAGLIEVPHPLDQVDHFPCIHGPEARASQKRRRVAGPCWTNSFSGWVSGMLASMAKMVNPRSVPRTSSMP